MLIWLCRHELTCVDTWLAEQVLHGRTSCMNEPYAHLKRFVLRKDPVTPIVVKQTSVMKYVAIYAMNVPV